MTNMDKQNTRSNMFFRVSVGGTPFPCTCVHERVNAEYGSSEGPGREFEVRPREVRGKNWSRKNK